MSLSSQVTLLATRIGQEIKSIKTTLAGKANASHTHVATTDLTATGTKDATTYLRGDNTWATPAGGGGGSSSGPELVLDTEYNSTTPAVPTVGAKLFARRRARATVSVVGPTGQDYALQPAFFSNRICRLTPQPGTTTVTMEGTAFTHYVNPTAITNPSPAGTNFVASIGRSRWASAATAGSSGGVRTTGQWFLSPNPNMGGFFFVSRVGLAAIPANARFFFGLSATASALPNADPSALVNTIGFVADAADTQMNFMTKGASGTATKVPLGTQFQARTGNTDFWEFRLYAPSGNASTVYWSAQRLNDGYVVTGSDSSTNLPVANAVLAVQAWSNNNTTASAASFDIQSLYIESDN